MAVKIAITNQKGGVGKTTTALNLGACLRKMGKKVLFIDMDPQCNLSYIMQGNTDGATINELLLGQECMTEVVQKTPEGLLIASSPKLSSISYYLGGQGSEYSLKKIIALYDNFVDFIIIDSPPTLGILTVNILVACDGVVIPSLADIFSLQGIGQLYATYTAVRDNCNPSLKLYGILLVRHTERFILHKNLHKMIDDTAAQMNTRVFENSIRDSIAVREAEASRKSLVNYAPRAKQTADYEAFTKELLDIIEK